MQATKIQFRQNDLIIAYLSVSKAYHNIPNDIKQIIVTSVKTLTKFKVTVKIKVFLDMAFLTLAPACRREVVAPFSPALKKEAADVCCKLNYVKFTIKHSLLSTLVSK